mgnify:CR=1 FL=1
MYYWCRDGLASQYVHINGTSVTSAVTCFAERFNTILGRTLVVPVLTYTAFYRFSSRNVAKTNTVNTYHLVASCASLSIQDMREHFYFPFLETFQQMLTHIILQLGNGTGINFASKCNSIRYAKKATIRTSPLPLLKNHGNIKRIIFTAEPFE